MCYLFFHAICIEWIGDRVFAYSRGPDEPLGATHKRQKPPALRMCREVDWETIADNLSKFGWSLAWQLSRGLRGRTIWIADAHCEKPPAFIESSCSQRDLPV